MKFWNCLDALLKLINSNHCNSPWRLKVAKEYQKWDRHNYGLKNISPKVLIRLLETMPLSAVLSNG